MRRLLGACPGACRAGATARVCSDGSPHLVIGRPQSASPLGTGARTRLAITGRGGSSTRRRRCQGGTGGGPMTTTPASGVSSTASGGTSPSTSPAASAGACRTASSRTRPRTAGGPARAPSPSATPGSPAGWRAGRGSGTWSTLTVPWANRDTPRDGRVLHVLAPGELPRRGVVAHERGEPSVAGVLEPGDFNHK